MLQFLDPKNFQRFSKKSHTGTLEELQHSVEDFYRESPEGWSCGKMTCTGLGALSSGAVCSLVAGKARLGWIGGRSTKWQVFVTVFFLRK